MQLKKKRIQQKRRGSSKPTRPRDFSKTVDRVQQRVTEAQAIVKRLGCLPWPCIHALHSTGGDAINFRDDIIQPMSEEPNSLLYAPKAQFPEEGFSTRHFCYDVPGKGRAPFSWHQVFVNVIRASFEHECEKAGLRLIHWSDDLGNPRVSPEARADLTGNKTMRIPLRIERLDNGERKVIEWYKPDDCLLIEYPNGTYRYLFIEADRGNQPYRGNSKNRHKYLKGMFEQMKEVTERKLFHSYLGFSSAFYLFIMSENDRHDLETIIADWKNDNGPSADILFLEVPRWTPNVMPLLTTPYKRAGHDDFDLSTQP